MVSYKALNTTIEGRIPNRSDTLGNSYGGQAEATTEGLIPNRSDQKARAFIFHSFWYNYIPLIASSCNCCFTLLRVQPVIKSVNRSLDNLTPCPQARHQEQAGGKHSHCKMFHNT